MLSEICVPWLWLEEYLLVPFDEDDPFPCPFSRKALWFLALLSAICWSADGFNVSGVLLLLLMHGLYIGDALDERLDELL